MSKRTMTKRDDSPQKLIQPEEKDKENHGDWRKDKSNIALLLFLYLLQGIPLGLAASIPLILINRGVTYKQQAAFSFAFWPFSVKLLWAPIVDSLYWRRIGRRKSWLVPTQYLIGIFMLILSTNIDGLLEEKDINISFITFIFFMNNFLAATQDIVVDGWALSILSRENVGYASTCNSAGQIAGYFLGYVVFMALESAEFCNNYLRSVPAEGGMVTLGDFLQFWGIIFLLTTTLVFIFKSEAEKNRNSEDPEPDTGVVEAYKLLWKITLLEPVKKIIIVLLTCKIGFAAADTVTGLKLIEYGVPKERMALIVVPIIPLQVILPMLISKHTGGSKPMGLFLKAWRPRLLYGLLYALLVYITPGFKQQDGSYPMYYYGIVLLFYLLHQILATAMFVAVMAWFNRVADPTVGGTYMTLLNTICNLGGNWPATVMLWLVEPLTFKTCDENQENCETWLDGYYIESVLCIVVGLMLFKWLRRTIESLQNLEIAQWRCR